MADMLTTIGDCAALIRDWEVTSQPGGLLTRLRTRESFGSTGAATAAGLALVDFITSAGYELVSEPVVRARADEARRLDGWHGWVELVLRRVPASEARVEASG